MIVTSRSLVGAQQAAEQLREEVGTGIDITGVFVCTTTMQQLVHSRQQVRLCARRMVFS